jgi:hypothetical protein
LTVALPMFPGDNSQYLSYAKPYIPNVIPAPDSCPVLFPVQRGVQGLISLSSRHVLAVS